MRVTVTDALPLHEPPDRLVGPHVVQPVGVGACDPDQLRQAVGGVGDRVETGEVQPVEPLGRPAVDVTHVRHERDRVDGVDGAIDLRFAHADERGEAGKSERLAPHGHHGVGASDDGERHVLVVHTCSTPADRVAATVGRSANDRTAREPVLSR